MELDLKKATLTIEDIEEFLIQKGLVNNQDIAKVRELGPQTTAAYIQALNQKGVIDEDTFGLLNARRRGIPYVDVLDFRPNSAAVMVVSEELARKYTALPLDFENNSLVVAMSDPSNILAIDDLRILTGYEIRPVVAMKSDIVNLLNDVYESSSSVEEEVLQLEEQETEKELKVIAEEAPIVKLVNMILTRAIREKASDIHIEPQEKDLRVRYRVDGVLHEVMHSPKRIQAAVLSRFKIMASMDIAERRKPQDGHASIVYGNSTVDFRVATLPTVYGERIVLRILGTESILLNLSDLGFLPQSLQRFETSYTKPYGCILVTGPTGSGKSTTLYATLNVLNGPDKNIVTIEDPVEYRLPGINQVQINTKAGLTFARGLRSILRASPDVILVGEIRDKETAEIAIEAALTGHLVLSTLHTNDAPGAITRLNEMGIQPFLIASAVDCVQAQRLARRLCTNCKEAYKPDLTAVRRSGFTVGDDEDLTFYRPRGCSKCGNTGYKGRLGLYEVMLMSEYINRLTIEEATSEQIKEIAVQEGMLTLKADGFEKVKQGQTSLEEILRVVA